MNSGYVSSVMASTSIRKPARHTKAPLVAVAADDASGEEAALALENWQHPQGECLHAAGMAQEQADELATLIIAAVEGAILLSRAQRSLTAFARVARQLERQVDTVLR